MILIVCGAGASYDSSPFYPPANYKRNDSFQRPPLADELFLADNTIVKFALKQFPQCHPILPHLASPDSTIEATLEKLQNQADADGVRTQQLAALRYYLQLLITRFEKDWSNVHRGVTNYLTLVDQLRRARGKEPVCIVTFNYDRMIEVALESVEIKITEIDGYIASPAFKLVKLHGSVNWVKKVIAPLSSVNIGRGELDVIGELIQNAAEIKTSPEFELCNQCPAGKIGTIPVWPALAIPTQTKRLFECPDDHLGCLKDLLRDTKKIVTIGWRGMEAHFLELLREALNGKRVGILTVAGDLKKSEQVIDNLRASGIETGAAISYEGGFTDVIKSEQIELFCK